jgi:hypothetical protein
MFYEDDRLLAVMPASLQDNELKSHGGLTYGGIISDRKMTAQTMLDIFSSLKEHAERCRISRLIYKRVPSIYYSYPSDEDLYALFMNNARLIRRDISTTIDMANRISFSKGRKCGVSKAKQAEIKTKEFEDFELFFECENKILNQKYSAKSTHTYEEMELLASRFPDNIKMVGGFLGEEFLAGVIIYRTETVVHLQYIVTTERGRELGALDLVIYNLIEYYANGKIRYFDFGISTEKNGRRLNQGLIRQKEMFGGCAIAHDFYEIHYR